MKRTLLCLLFLLSAAWASAADYPQPVPGDFVIKDFKFASGETLPELRVHYRTLGVPLKDAHGRVTNAVLILHGTTGSGENFLNPNFAGVLFVPGGLLDASKYYIVIPDGIGHGQSSKPSDGLHARFPRYGYDDMVTAQYRLLTEGLGVDHLRLVMGTSMGGMHTWVWAEKYPDFMDAALPLACLPVQIAGRNRAWRKMAVDAIRNDPAFNQGDYTAQPYGLIVAIDMLWLMSSSPVQRQKDAPTREQADKTVTSSWRRSGRRTTPTTSPTPSTPPGTTTRNPSSPPSRRHSWPSTSPTTSSTRRSWASWSATSSWCPTDAWSSSQPDPLPAVTGPTPCRRCISSTWRSS